MDGMEMGSGSGSSAMMPMYFNTDLPVTVAFQNWVIDDKGTLTGSCFGVGALAILFEFLKVLRLTYWDKYSRWRSVTKKNAVGPVGKGEDRKSEPANQEDPYKFWIAHFLHGLIYCVQVFLGYLLMLIVMTYNAWLVLSIILGLSLGYFISHGLPIRVWTTSGEIQSRTDSVGQVTQCHMNSVSGQVGVEMKVADNVSEDEDNHVTSHGF